MASERGPSMTGLGLRNKAKGDKITGLGIRDKAKGGAITGLGIRQKTGLQKAKPTNSHEGHEARPLHTLKDPSNFGPPPKNINYHGGAALPNQITPDRRGLGAPLTQAQLTYHPHEEEEEAQREADEEARIKRSQPFRADTTGLSTQHLPPPPGRRDGADGRSPPPALPAARGPPGLPPRLPPRQNSSPMASPPPVYSTKPAAPEPDSHRGMLNQGALNRLGNAGVSVPAFEIGSRGRAPLPPPRQLSPAKETPSPVASPVGNSNPQLNELQSRFSRLSHTTPTSESSSQGTTFAQKQAALKTASSFRNDPSSVSVQDAKSAASTANNFRDRHGEQVKTGWQSANKLNTKYGVADKIGSYGQSSQQPASPQIEMRDNTISPPPIGGLGKKKPPPPPPAKKSQLAGNSVGGAGLPPPIPLASKPKPSLSRAPEGTSYFGDQFLSHDLDLSLQSLWFAKSPVILPPSIVGTQGKKIHASSSSWSSMGSRKTHNYTAIVQDNVNLSRNIFELTWDASNPGATVKSRQKYIPPPRSLSWNELESYRQSYSDAVAKWCESKIGRQVGNGECWTLANEGLKAVAETCKSRGKEPCMPSQSYVHGALIYSFIPNGSANPETLGSVIDTGVSRGDVVQILSAVFTSKDGRRTAYAGAPDHTAVVTSVEASGILRVVESNVGGSKDVRKGSYDMSELVKGEVRIFRAVGENWLGKLEPTW